MRKENRGGRKNEDGKRRRTGNHGRKMKKFGKQGQEKGKGQGYEEG